MISMLVWSTWDPAATKLNNYFLPVWWGCVVWIGFGLRVSGMCSNPLGIQGSFFSPLWLEGLMQPNSFLCSWKWPTAPDSSSCFHLLSVQITGVCLHTRWDQGLPPTFYPCEGVYRHSIKCTYEFLDCYVHTWLSFSQFFSTLRKIVSGSSDRFVCDCIRH